MGISLELKIDPQNVHFGFSGKGVENTPEWRGLGRVFSDFSSFRVISGHFLALRAYIWPFWSKSAIFGQKMALCAILSKIRVLFGSQPNNPEGSKKVENDDF